MKRTSLSQYPVAASRQSAANCALSAKECGALPRRRYAIIALLATSVAATAQTQTPAATGASAAITVRELRYEASLADHEARIVADVDAECAEKTGGSLLLFEGDVAVMRPKLPDQLTLVRDGNRYSLSVPRGGRFKFKLELVAKIQRAEPWNQVSFIGPSAAIASIVAQARSAGMEVQLLSGTLVESSQTNGVSRVRGLLGAERAVALRWQGKVTEVARKALITADTTVSAQITPTVIKYTTQIRYDILQGTAPRLTLALPAAHALTRLVGEQIRDWQVKVGQASSLSSNDVQILTVEFIKPPEKSCTLTLYSEQTVEAGAPARLDPPQPLEIERETGSLTLNAEDMVAETDSLTGLRQVNATAGALAAYRFNGRPFTLALKLKRIEPVITAADRVTARLEETRLVIAHSLALEVEKAGIYAVELVPQTGLTVAEVRGEGIEDWKVSEGKLKVNFSARVLGSRKLDVQLEQALKTFPEQLTVSPLRVTGATKETAQVGAASAPGIRLKTGELIALREIPVNRLANRTDELLAYSADQPDWKLALASERLAARLVADVFNLVTIGDGLVGGSATIRYRIGNQGVQEFKVKLPPHCKNVEFTGPNIRRKELAGEVWTIGLQDKAWGGYTLVVTYDFPFDPKGATLAVGGIHAADAERETGSVAITTAASLKLSARTVSDSARRVDETELTAADRTLVTRAVVLAYQYAGEQYDLAVVVKCHDELPVLEAVADRTQITSVLTEAGEMLTQASFMVKNNAKQYQQFKLPAKADLWGCYVNGQPAKPERNGEWVMVPLPREMNRDQAFAVDIVYAQTNNVAKTRWSQPLQLAAPTTDVPNTYAEWQLYVPATLRLASFGGTMAVAQGTTYDMLDAWRKFLFFYLEVLREAGPAPFVIGVLAFLVIALVMFAAKRGASGVIELLVVVAIMAILAGMMLPALSKAKAKSQRINSVNNLKQIGLAAHIFAGDNDGRLPVSFEEMMNELNTDKVTYDTETGQRYTYLGAGFNLNEITPDSVLAYSPIFNGHCNIVLADGSVEQISATRFAEYAQRGLVRRIPTGELAARHQAEAVRNAQLQPPVAAAPQPAPVAQSPQPIQPLPKPLARGLRSIRIELPREGNAFLFTKVLNLGDVPLTVRARVMSLEVFRNVQMAGQLAAFLLGLGVWWWQWRGRRNSFVLTCALALVLGSVGSLLVAWRAMHDALIVGFPIVVLGGVSWLIWKAQLRRKASAARKAAAAPPTGDNLPPAMAAAALVLGLFVASARADLSPAPDPEVRSVGRVRPVGLDHRSVIASILNASYTGSVNDRVAQIEATLRVSTAQPDQLLPLFGEDVAIQQFAVKSGDAKLVREGNGVGVRLGKRGEAMLQVRFVTKIGGDVTKRRLGFAIPPALTTQVALVVDQPDADVDFPTAISVKRTTEAEKTRVEAIIGSGERVELLWTPRVKRAAEVAATLFCQNTSLATVGGGVVSVRSVLDYQVTQGELRQARVRLPAGQRLLRVEGEGIRTWELKDENGGQTLVVELLKGVAPAYRLTLETERALDALPATAGIEMPHALDVKRESGLIALRGAEELTLSIETARELQRVDAEEFARAGTLKAEGLFSVFRFLKPEFELRARAETVQPQIEAVVRNNIRVNTDLENVSAVVDYTIKRAGVFTLKLALPPGYHLDQVRGDKVQQWAERTEGDARVLEVTLKERISGSYMLNVELSKIYGTLPQPLPVVGVHPMGAAKLTAFISVAANPGVAVKTESFDGLTEIPAATLPDYNSLGGLASVLAFKHIAPEPKAAPDWKLAVTTETVEAWVRAEIVNTLTLTETLISGRALVRYDIANAPVGELRLKTPATFRNVEITGANIRRLDQQGDGWRVVLQSKVRGIHTLTVTWEQPRAGKTNAVELTGVTADGVERETGLLAIVAKPPLQVGELSAADLRRVDTNELPDWAGRPDDATVLAYRYARPGYRLALDARRYDEAEVLQALADSVRLTTVVADDGQAMTELSLAVRNNGRQFLEVELPAGAKVWSAFVAGQPVRPSRREGKLLLPLQEWGADEETVAVELTYVGTNKFPQTRGDLSFISPKLDVPLKGAQWELYLPADYRYADFEGTMTREVAATPSLWSFGLSEYMAMEKKGKAAWKAEVEKDVTRAQSNLSSGNVREAVQGYNRAKGRQIAGATEEAQVKQLEQQLRNVQAGNLLKAQQDFSVNNGVFANSQPAQPPGQAANYDNAAAEQQWTKLAQAQEIAVAKVQPLHVNLPLRGLRYAFTQVLQTEVNKPMTIQLSASNTKTGHWLGRLGMGLVGFLALWAVVAVVAARKRA